MVYIKMDADFVSVRELAQATMLSEDDIEQFANHWNIDEMYGQPTSEEVFRRLRLAFKLRKHIDDAVLVKKVVKMAHKTPRDKSIRKIERLLASEQYGVEVVGNIVKEVNKFFA